MEPEYCLPCSQEPAIDPYHEPDESRPHTHKLYEVISVAWKQTVQVSLWPTCRSQVIRQMVKTWPHSVSVRLVRRHPNLQEQDRDMSYGRLSFETLDWDARAPSEGGGGKVTECCSVPQLKHGYGFGLLALYWTDSSMA
jgi:hypothetical protein